MIARIGQLGQDNGVGTTEAEQSGENMWERTTKTGQLGQVNVDRSA
jgi:hypothetical protein